MIEKAMGIFNSSKPGNKKQIFISYRRNDSEYAASMIHDQLTAHFGEGSVFRDMESIEPGASYSQTITDTIRESSVCLVVIGKDWLFLRDQDGRRRIDNPADFIRLEIETAFALDKPVVPILVGGARLPTSEELPDGLGRLNQLQALEIYSGKHMAASISHLIRLIERYIPGPGQIGTEVGESIPYEPQPEPVAPSEEFQTPKHPAGNVFISYSRDGGAETARLIRYELVARDWSVFLDVEDLKGGRFDETLLAKIAAADNFLLVLSPGALENCKLENNWLGREIKQAIKTDRHIVPLLKENALAPDKQELAPGIEPLKTFNCVSYSHVYYEATISKLIEYLKIPSA